MESFGKKGLKPETLAHTKAKVEQGLNQQMPIPYRELKRTCFEDTGTEKLFDEMLRYATDYVKDVWGMKELLAKRKEYTDEEWSELFARADDERTRLHNTYIDSIAILLRNMNRLEMDTEWARQLLGPDGKLERGRCGNFAIMIVYSEYVNSREG